MVCHMAPRKRVMNWLDRRDPLGTQAHFFHTDFKKRNQINRALGNSYRLYANSDKDIRRGGTKKLGRQPDVKTTKP